jgi:hypothetical protein
MQPVRKISPFTIAAIFLLVAALFSIPALLIRDVYREWGASHKALYQYIQPLDSIAFRLNGLANQVGIKMFGSSDPGVEQVRLYISEQKIKSLQSDLPASVKDWKKGRMLYPDGSIDNVQIRHRGDNPANWLYRKKSWRIKTRKEHLIDKTRSFNLIAPQDPVFIDTHFYLTLARNCGLIAGDTRMVELVLNGETQGVHTEAVQLDENFLRNNNIMPVNLYKGEQRMSERRYGLEFDLYSNPALWTKDSVNNYTLDPTARDPETDMSDLAYIFRVSQEALRGGEAFDELRSILDWDYWAKFAAYEMLTQQSYDALHNNRLVADIWKGKVLPLPIDPQSVPITDASQVVLYQFGSRQGILDRLERSAEFRTDTLAALRELLDSGCLSRTVEEMRNLLPALETSISRDPGVYQSLGQRSYLTFDAGEEIGAFLDGFSILETELRRQADDTGPLGWSATPGKLAIASGSTAAVGPWKAVPEAGQAMPRDVSVWWDRNGDGEIGTGDVELPVRVEGDGLLIDAKFAGNFQRTSSASQSLAENYGSMPEIRPALFRLIFNHPGITVSAMNLMTADGPAPVTRAMPETETPNGLNLPVTPKMPAAVKHFSGDVTISGVEIIDQPVVVDAGTRFRMTEGASLVLRGRTEMNGTAGAPIQFEPLESGKNWGVLAIQGPEASGSVLRHVELRGGSGARAGLTRLIAMLSVHDTSNVLLDNLFLTENAVEDDMIHIIYSHDVTVRNVHMVGARSDAIDIDISTVRVEGGRIEMSGNDAIDLMSTRAVIDGPLLVDNGDKGVSVGEGSDATILNTTIRRNVIGVQSKDGSIAEITGSEFDNNRMQLSAYQKNWRYADGGRITAGDSTFSADGKAGSFSADPKSQIEIGNSKLEGDAEVSGLVTSGGTLITPSGR